MKFLTVISIIILGELAWIGYVFQSKLTAMQKLIPDVLQINSWLPSYFYLLAGITGLMIIFVIIRKPKLMVLGIVIQLGMLSYVILAQSSSVDPENVRYFKTATGTGRFAKITYDMTWQLTRRTGQYVVYVNPPRGQLTNELRQYIKASGLVLRTLRVEDNADLSLLVDTGGQPLIANKPRLIIVGQNTVTPVKTQTPWYVFWQNDAHDLRTSSEFKAQLAKIYG